MPERYHNTITRPADVERILDSIIEQATALQREIAEIEQIAYSRLPGPRTEKVKQSGTYDSTGELAVRNPHMKAHYRRACAFIVKSRDFILKASEACDSVVKAGDAHADFRDPEGRYGAPFPEGFEPISTAEHRRLERRKAEREAARRAM